MSRLLVFVLALPLASVACAKEKPSSSTTEGQIKPGEQEESLPPQDDMPGAKDGPSKVVEPMAAPQSDAGAAAQMSAVHAHLRAGKKLLAVKEYRELHGKLALNASKIGVEVEQEKLGIPSTMDVHKLYFSGKKDEALVALGALYGKPTDSPGIQRLWATIQSMGPATEENLKAKAAGRESTAALAIYHHLHPEVPIPEAWRAVEALMGQ